MYDNFKIANYSNTLLSPELYARPLSRLFKGEVIDGFTVIPGAGLQVILNPGNAFVRYGSTNVASARIVSLVADFALTIPTPDASNPRIDSVVLYVDMAETLPVVDANNPPTAANLDGPGVAKAIIVSGTPAAVPVKPTETAIQSAVGAGNPYIVLGNVTVDPGVSVIAGGKIADARSFAKLGSSNIDSATFPFGYAEKTSGTTSTSTSLADIPQLSLTVDVPPGTKRLKILAQIPNTGTNGGNGTTVRFAIVEGSTILNQISYSSSIQGHNYSQQVYAVVLDPTPGEHTYKVQGSNSSGTLYVNVSPTIGTPFILVEPL